MRVHNLSCLQAREEHGSSLLGSAANATSAANIFQHGGPSMAPSPTPVSANAGVTFRPTLSPICITAPADCASDAGADEEEQPSAAVGARSEAGHGKLVVALLSSFLVTRLTRTMH